MLTAAFAALLGRYSGQDRLLLGVRAVAADATTGDRTVTGTDAIVLHADLSGDPTAAEWIARAHVQWTQAQAEGPLPLAMLVASPAAAEDPSRHPLFQAAVELHNHAPDLRTSAGAEARTPSADATGACPCDLTLRVHRPYEAGGECSLEYAAKLFERPTIERMAGHFVRLLEGFAADPGRRLSALSLLDEAERHRLCVGFNDTRRDYPRDALVHHAFEAHALRSPDRTAVRFENRAVTYAELDARANRIARELRARGVGRGRRVGLCVERGVDMLAAVAGVLKAGAAYVPLDPAFPEERLRYMVEDAQLALLVSTSALATSLGMPRERQVLLDGDAGAIESHAGTPLPADASLDARADDPAYVIYTSGSTGRPKGVVVPHRAVVNFLSSMAREPGLSGDDVLLAVTTLSFDIAVLELQLPLAVGAAVVVARRDEALDGRALAGLAQRHGATVMQATPITWRLLLESGWRAAGPFKALVGGEALPKELADRLLAAGVELWNMYGPTETTVWSTCGRITDTSRGIDIGRPIANTTVYVLDAHGQPCPVGVPGELCIGGEGVTLGYWRQPELTAERFVADAFGGDPGMRLYRTGDRARWRADGTLEHLGRLDFQVKVRGFRIELGEIEATLDRVEGVGQSAVVVREDTPGDARLIAYYTGREAPPASTLREALAASLPEYMIPSVFVRLDAFPLTPNGKLDRKALPAPRGGRPQLAQEFVAPHTPLERQLAAVWRELLQLDEVGIDDPFFELGGTSLAAVRMVNLFRARHGHEIPLVKVFQYPTIAQLCRFLEQGATDTRSLDDIRGRAERLRRERRSGDRAHRAVAIVGMVGRFPGAENVEQLWRNLCDGVESISVFAPEELGPGIEAHLRDDPDYVRARGMIEGAELFDAAFFGISPLEAQVMDPQQRVFLELAHQALESAGCDPERYAGRIGVYAGIGDNHYYTTNLLTHPELMAMAGKLAVEYGNQKDYIALRTAYLLDLRGPAVSSNTACSTALLTVDQAWRALLDDECDVALAGGIDITVPQRSGFLYQEGGTFARDGHCRPFDAEATGTMFCDGAGIVVLKRLDDALADGDTIHAVLIGSGKNNNGARPASFLAPSVDGQAEAIAIAQARADVPVETIRYVEAHGTGTPVGDPIELEALNKVFKARTDRRHYCYVGSIKGNIGHPTNAAGVAGLIKAALVLEREQVPATLHFSQLNPRIDLSDSPFVIADRRVPLPRGDEPRRAAVSSFGFGGTNVHTIIEEPPLPVPGSASRPMQLLLLSARTPASLDGISASLADHLEGLAPERLPDAAFTLQTGRRQMAQRRFVVAADPAEAARLLRKPNPLRAGSRRCTRRDPPVVFMFGGQGTQYVNMGQNLYRDEPLFRAIVDDCCEILRPHLGRDLRELLYPAAGDVETARVSLQDTFFTQPSIFVIEYALARFWQSLGVRPVALIGHSIGEFVAATLAGVWDLEDALRIIALRGRLMQALPRGSMLAVNAGASTVEPTLPATVQIASVNAPGLCVVAGPEADVEAVKAALEAQDVVCRALHTSHAFHSAMMDPMVEPLREAVSRLRLRAPSIPIVSTVRGAPITEADATDPAYWAHHARATVQFSNAVQRLLDDGHELFLECGPRATLSSLVRQHVPPGRSVSAIPSLSDTHENDAEWAAALVALGSLWQNGVSIDWDAFYAHEDRRKVTLPLYVFDRQRYWVDPAPVAQAPASDRASIAPAAAVAPGPSSVVAQPAAPVPVTVAADRRTRIADRLVELLAPLSGLEPSQIVRTDTFVEQGFNSLSLTQVAIAIRKAFGVRMTFRQLLNELPSVDMVAASLDAQMPPEAFAAPAPEAPPPQGAVPCGAAAPGAGARAVPATAPGTGADLPVPTVAPITVAPSPAAPAPLVALPPASLERVLADQAAALSRLASLLERFAPMPDGSAPASVGRPPAPPVEATVPLPLTDAQRRVLHASHESDDASRVFVQSFALHLRGPLDHAALEGALQDLADRHDALRTVFAVDGDRQRVLQRGPLPLPFVDLSGLAPADRQRRLAETVDALGGTVFDLASGPLVKARLVRLGPDEHRLLLASHQVVMDGWATHVVALELGRMYSARAAGRVDDAPPALQLRDYVGWYFDAQTVASRDEDERYWKAAFADLPASVELPSAKRARLAARTHRAGHVDTFVDAALVARLRKVGAASGATPFHVLLASCFAWLHRVAGQTEVVVGVPIAGQIAANLQHLPGCDRLIAHTTNVLPIRAETGGATPFVDLLAEVRRRFVEAREHQGFGCADLVRVLDPPRDAGHLPFVSVTLNLDDEPEMRWEGLTAEFDAPPRGFVAHDLEVGLVEGPDGMRVRAHFSEDLFEAAVVETWLAQWLGIMAAVADDPTLPLGRLGVIDRPDVADHTAPRTPALPDAQPATHREPPVRRDPVVALAEPSTVVATEPDPASRASEATWTAPPVPARDAFFFGPLERQRFGTLHRPASGEGRVLTVVCPPLFSEHARTWLALRRLAATLADRGQHVLRFDWLGTGDSSGDLTEISLDDWIDDVALAVGEGRRLSGCDEVRLVGVRAGALLACRFAATHPEVTRMVAWDPVPDGASYLDAVRRVQAAAVAARANLRSADRDAALQELRGFRASERIQAGLASLAGSVWADAGADRLRIVKTSAAAGPAVPGADVQVVRYACRWDVESEDVLIPVPVLERLARCLIEP